jgi:DNA-binding transcriptional MerR regulator
MESWMEKSAEAFLSIGEMSKRLSSKPHILRYWEEHFPMLKPLKRAGGRRLYRPDDVALLHTIDRLINHEGYTIKGACKYLRDTKKCVAQESVPLENPHSANSAQLDSTNLVFELQAIRNRLSAALAAA